MIKKIYTVEDIEKILNEVDNECCWWCDCHPQEIEKKKNHFSEASIIEEIKKRFGIVDTNEQRPTVRKSHGYDEKK